MEKYDFAKHGDFSDYQLQDKTYTAHPTDAIRDCQSDSARQPVVILKEGQIVGYFTLHYKGGPETYGYDSDKRVLVRALSIDDRYRHKGYGSQAMQLIFSFIETNLKKEIERILLGVNVKNIPAQDMYKKLGFKSLRDDFPGSFGNLIIMEKARN